MDRLLLVARKDARDAIRDRTLYAVGILFTLVGLGLGYLVGASPSPQPEALPTFGLLAMIFVGSLASVSLSYNGIVGKRQSGELRVLLGLPLSRLEVVAGTLLGRFVVVGAVSVGSLVVASLLAVVLGGAVDAGLLITALPVLLVVVALFVSVAVALSAATSDTTKASIGAFGLFMLLVFRLWELVPTVFRYVLNGFSLPRETPVWARAWSHLSPLAGFRNAVDAVAPALARSFSGFAPSVADPSAVFVQPVFGAVVVAVWLVGPITLGYWTFSRADL